MWWESASAVGMGLALAAVAFLIARISLVVGERSLERKAGRVGLRKMMVMRAKIEQGLETRRNKRMEEIRALDLEVKQLFLRRQQLERALIAAKNDSERLVRLIGEEIEGTPCYVAKVINKYSGVGVPQQKGAILVDRGWAQPQEIEVWVRTVGDARNEIEHRYPPAFGFHITRLNELGVQESKIETPNGVSAA
jgi:hypothetical protein